MKKLQIIKDILVFNQKPKLKIGQRINEILTDNGFYKYSTEVYVYKIQKIKNEYKVYLTEI